ncbi:transglycosylase SLT domain-containing protein [Aliiroseovarius sp. M344]|uniref:transglycosylase SLT domain-containing protein n=1 Tax=Aliiroseovarius sp. M344 TaxID=2867010 RepID=UPI0021AD5B6F|nr:transglycosylase SLT domain-containing protein [Aliiroseovarius sp. M344]UWQ14493.1 transglycosylase SLT domain-containing protein [Aliiroseovarius sp. M344]
MSRLLRAALILLFVASCGGDSKAPRNLDNACSIIKQRPNIYRALKRTERKWNVPTPVLMAMIYQESKFIKDARTPVKYVLGVLPMGRQSSAYGYAQALDATWKEYQRAEGGRGARRTDIKDAADFMGWYMNETRDKTGIPLNDARNQYLAYHEGRTGYLRGSYQSKAWLLRIASEVNARAILYQRQLASCRR